MIVVQDSGHTITKNGGRPVKKVLSTIKIPKSPVNEQYRGPKIMKGSPEHSRSTNVTFEECSVSSLTTKKRHLGNIRRFIKESFECSRHEFRVVPLLME
jgi:hypothetical protein